MPLAKAAKRGGTLIVVPITVALDRSPEEFAAGHVPGAVNIPYTYLPASISELKDAADKDIVIYCETGVRAERAVSRLKEHGFTRLLHLDGDMKQWREKQLPVSKEGS